MWPLECSQGFSFISSSDILFDPHDPVSNLTEIWSRTSFWASLKLIRLKMWPVEASQAIVDDQHQTPEDRQGPITIAHHEHFMLWWPKKLTGFTYPKLGYITNRTLSSQFHFKLTHLLYTLRHMTAWTAFEFFCTWFLREIHTVAGQANLID